ncbi:MAG: thioredoxin family protein [Fibromonadales bacterium]|nr:thioredoxin family protein [Fibromonadales bacterium]
MFLLLLFFVFIGASAQETSISLNNMAPPETQLFYSRLSPKAGDTLYLKVTIPQGWHINSDKVSDKFLIPSSVEPVAKDMKFDAALWPEPLEVHNEVLKMDLLLLQDTFTVKLPVNFIEENGNPYNAKLKFTYQACSNICLAPKTMEIKFDNTMEKKNFDSQETELALLYIVILAFFGGLILNFMPCVLPILFLKIFDLIRKSGESKRNMLKWGFATTGGICSAFFAIASIIFVIRLMGHAVGWGFQFQYPAYTATMALCLMVFALSLWGIFDIWMPGNMLKVWEKRAKQGGTTGAFAYGILLVLLSTPCSAPFLGTAVGFAFAASNAQLFLIFAAVAFGMSFPYLVLSAFPQWTAKLPKPGAWMLVLRRLLGFPLLLTVVWLVWIFGKQTDSGATFKLGMLLCAGTFFAWLSGLIAKPGKSWWRFVLLWFIFAIMYIFLWSNWISPQIRETGLNEISGKDGEWVVFSEERLDSLQSEGYAVWINGTADWCITCKMNEKTVFEDENVKNAFEEIPVVKMRANYTNSNPEALKFFQLYGRSGVPFDLLLTAQQEPILLPEILTANTVVETLWRAY